MRLLNYLIIACSLLVSSAWSGEKEAIHWHGNGTGFTMAGNLFVTVKHCKKAENEVFKIAGKDVKAHRVYQTPAHDGAVIFELEGGPYDSLPFAQYPPAVGDKIYTAGYPSGYWGVNHGKVIGLKAQLNNHPGDYLVTDHRINPGQSGGPLLNAKGEVIGVSVAVDTEIYQAYSFFSTHADLKAGLCQAVEKPEIVVFSIPNCGGCVRLENDYNAGKFPGYTFTFVKWNGVAWDNPDLCAEFQRDANPPQNLGYPIIWVRGTAKYKQGYGGQPRGLLGWLGDVVKEIIHLIIGKNDNKVGQAPAPPIRIPPREEWNQPGTPGPPITPPQQPEQYADNQQPANQEETPYGPLAGLLVGALTGWVHRRYGG